MLVKTSMRLAIVLGLLILASGCKSKGMPAQPDGPNSLPPATGGIGSWFANAFAGDAANGRDPYSSPSGTGDYYPSSPDFGPVGGKR